MLKDLGNSEKLADLEKSFYKKAVDEGNGELFISELRITESDYNRTVCATVKQFLFFSH